MSQDAETNPERADWWHHQVAATLFSELPQQPGDALIVAELVLQMVTKTMAKLPATAALVLLAGGA